MDPPYFQTGCKHNVQLSIQHYHKTYHQPVIPDPGLRCFKGLPLVPPGQRRSTGLLLRFASSGTVMPCPIWVRPGYSNRTTTCPSSRRVEKAMFINRQPESALDRFYLLIYPEHYRNSCPLSGIGLQGKGRAELNGNHKFSRSSGDGHRIMSSYYRGQKTLPPGLRPVSRTLDG